MLTYYEFWDTKGKIKKIVKDADPSLITIMPRICDDSGSCLMPSQEGYGDLLNNSSSTPLHIETDYNYGYLKRLAEKIGPEHTIDIDGVATTIRPVTMWVYRETCDSGQVFSSCNGPEIWEARGYRTGAYGSYEYILINPVTITKQDKDGRTTDVITAKRTSTSGGGKLLPTDIFARSDWQSWRSISYDAAGRTEWERVYHTIPSSGDGTNNPDAFYAQTNYGYDVNTGMENRVETPGGTITRTVYDGFNRVKSIWLGIDDVPSSGDWSPGNPAGMRKICENSYKTVEIANKLIDTDRLEKETVWEDASNTRETLFNYDWRNRLESEKNAIDNNGNHEYENFTYNNLDNIIKSETYAFTSSGHANTRQG